MLVIKPQTTFLNFEITFKKTILQIKKKFDFFQHLAMLRGPIVRPSRATFGPRAAN